MLKTIQGVTDEQGNVRIEGKDKLTPHQRVVVVYEEDAEEFVNGVPLTMLLSEKALGEYWNRPEEDEAWKDFQDKAK
jgi:hypothetical protein